MSGNCGYLWVSKMTMVVLMEVVWEKMAELSSRRSTVMISKVTETRRIPLSDHAIAYLQPCFFGDSFGFSDNINARTNFPFPFSFLFFYFRIKCLHTNTRIPSPKGFMKPTILTSFSLSSKHHRHTHQLVRRHVITRQAQRLRRGTRII